jgi:hypothetical protein
VFSPLIQVIRSVGPWSAGTTQIEGSIHNAYFSLIEKAEHFVYIEVLYIFLFFSYIFVFKCSKFQIVLDQVYYGHKFDIPWSTEIPTCT